MASRDGPDRRRPATGGSGGGVVGIVIGVLVLLLVGWLAMEALRDGPASAAEIVDRMMQALTGAWDRTAGALMRRIGEGFRRTGG